MRPLSLASPLALLLLSHTAICGELPECNHAFTQIRGDEGCGFYASPTIQGLQDPPELRLQLNTERTRQDIDLVVDARGLNLAPEQWFRMFEFMLYSRELPASYTVAIEMSHGHGSQETQLRLVRELEGSTLQYSHSLSDPLMVTPSCMRIHGYWERIADDRGLLNLGAVRVPCDQYPTELPPQPTVLAQVPGTPAFLSIGALDYVSNFVPSGDLGQGRIVLLRPRLISNPQPLEDYGRSGR